MATKSSSNGTPPPAAPASTAIDFGFDPAATEHHFLVVPKGKDVYFFEQFAYDADLDFAKLGYEILNPGSPCRCILGAEKWELVAGDVRAEFNRRLRDMGVRRAAWRKGSNYVHRLLGKELMVLIWAVEEGDPGKIPLAVQNWLGLKPEERWWLYTIANAATGHAIHGRGKGWRQALRYALADNPVPHDRVNMNLYQDATAAPAANLLFDGANNADPDAALLSSAGRATQNKAYSTARTKKKTPPTA